LALATILLFAAAAAAEPATTVVPSEFELKPAPPSPRITQDCRRSAAAGEIVVCGRSRDEYRARELRPPPGIVDPGGVIGLDLGGARLEPKLEQVGMPEGRISKRIMVTVKMPF
jgi:hypothetical protein